MPMTVVITSNVSGRVRGFLASCMLQVAAGVYTAPRMSTAVRERVEAVLGSWFPHEREGSSILMTWADTARPEGQGVVMFGSPPYELVEYDGVVLSTLCS